MDLNVIVPNHAEENEVKEVAMGGKHQRNLSLSAKWANDKSMAIEYLRRQREVVTWIENVLKRELPTTDLYEALKSGVVLRETMETLFPDVSNCMSPISRNYNKRMAPWKERENISVFLRQCKSIGMYDLLLFCTDDLYEGTNMVQVLFCIQHFMLFSEEHAGHRFKPVDKNQPAEFSNQELEMAMSKIEQAGVDAKALQGLMSKSNATRSPAIVEEGALITEEGTSELSPLKSTEKCSIEEEEPAKSEDSSEEKIKVEVEAEVCNQVLEDMQAVETPADDADINPEQEDAVDDDEEEAVELEEISMVKQDAIDAVEVPIVTVSVEDEETMAIIQQVLSDMASAIEESEAEAKWKAIAMAPSHVETETPTIIEPTSPPALAAELSAEAELETKSETVDAVNIEVEVEVKADLNVEEKTDLPTEPTAPTEDASAQPAVDSSKKATERIKDKNAEPTDEEELEAKAMAKCTCGKDCAIM